MSATRAQLARTHPCFRECASCSRGPTACASTAARSDAAATERDAANRATPDAPGASAETRPDTLHHARRTAERHAAPHRAGTLLRQRRAHAVGRARHGRSCASWPEIRANGRELNSHPGIRKARLTHRAARSVRWPFSPSLRGLLAPTIDAFERTNVRSARSRRVPARWRPCMRAVSGRSAKRPVQVTASCVSQAQHDSPERNT